MINQLLVTSCMIEIVILVGLLLSNQKLCEQQKWLIEGKCSKCCFGIKNYELLSYSNSSGSPVARAVAYEGVHSAQLLLQRVPPIIILAVTICKGIHSILLILLSVQNM